VIGVEKNYTTPKPKLDFRQKKVVASQSEAKINKL